MAMSSSALAAELKAMALFGTEAEAVDAWGEAFGNYFADAECNSIPINPTILPTAKSAMKSALSGMSASGAGAGKIQAGIVAFWAALTPPASVFTGCIAIAPPPTLSGIGVALQTVFDSNTSSGASKDDAMDAIAAVLHTNNLGGQGTFPGPLVYPIL